METRVMFDRYGNMMCAAQATEMLEDARRRPLFAALLAGFRAALPNAPPLDEDVPDGAPDEEWATSRLVGRGVINDAALEALGIVDRGHTLLQHVISRPREAELMRRLNERATAAGQSEPYSEEQVAEAVARDVAEDADLEARFRAAVDDRAGAGGMKPRRCKTCGRAFRRERRSHGDRAEQRCRAARARTRGYTGPGALGRYRADLADPERRAAIKPAPPAADVAWATS